MKIVSSEKDLYRPFAAQLRSGRVSRLSATEVRRRVRSMSLKRSKAHFLFLFVAQDKKETFYR
jgi:hypothetical protein